MQEDYQRDNDTKGLVNNNISAYHARILAKKRNKEQAEEIQSLKDQIEELKAIVNTLLPTE